MTGTCHHIPSEVFKHLRAAKLNLSRWSVLFQAMYVIPLYILLWPVVSISLYISGSSNTTSTIFRVQDLILDYLTLHTQKINLQLSFLNRWIKVIDPTPVSTPVIRIRSFILDLKIPSVNQSISVRPMTDFVLFWWVICSCTSTKTPRGQVVAHINPDQRMVSTGNLPRSAHLPNNGVIARYKESSHQFISPASIVCVLLACSKGDWELNTKLKISLRK